MILLLAIELYSRPREKAQTGPFAKLDRLSRSLVSYYQVISMRSDPNYI